MDKNRSSPDRVAERVCRRVFLPLLVTPGVRANVRGRALNRAVEERLRRLVRAAPKGMLSVAFESRPTDDDDLSKSMEIADWILTDERTNTKRVLLGYTQRDLWSGGAQRNRGGKYVLDDALHARLADRGITLICVVGARIPQARNNTTSRISLLRAKGLRSIDACQRRIVYPDELPRLVRAWLAKEDDIFSVRGKANNDLG
jgi:hypothetical protein